VKTICKVVLHRIWQMAKTNIISFQELYCKLRILVLIDIKMYVQWLMKAYFHWSLQSWVSFTCSSCQYGSHGPKYFFPYSPTYLNSRLSLTSFLQYHLYLYDWYNWVNFSWQTETLHATISVVELEPHQLALEYLTVFNSLQLGCRLR